ncbi:retrotransposon protein, putative, ty1-copia subclass [Tanacetum coccineum]|uniref:Retrotransposon protein, putative, ty1-copia subclass n=1 Tax=Tanacetum coccineum TaxID=301880 RepID=A0ABQ4X907_9ASTR
MVRSMMNLTTLPKSFWGYALESAVRILNMVPTKKVERTPYEIWHGKAPKLSYLRVWGCEALMKRDTPDKLDPRSIKCIFVGYPKETMGYYFYYPLENKIFVARNAEFFENNLMVQEASGSHGPLESSGSDEGLELIQEEDTQPSENTSEEHNEVAPIVVEPQNVEVPIHRSARIPQAQDRYGFYVDVEEYELGDLDEPPNYKVALSDPESDKWLEAMNTEMQSMKDNQVWVLVELPPNGQTVRNYEETFSLVADIRAIRILLAIATFYGYEIWQMDVKPAFLNGHLSEDVYMVQPEAFAVLKQPNRVCKLQCSIYGLKQSSRREATYIPGIKIIRDKSKRLTALSQSAYLEKTLKKFRMENSKKRYTPMIEKPDYRKSQGAKTPSEVQRYVVSIIGGAVDWMSAKQSTTAMSSTEAEYIATAEASMETVWMRKFIDGLGNVVPSNKGPMEMLCDNEHIIAITNDLRILKGARHFQRKYHYIREVIQEREIVLKKVHIDDNIVDPFTKPMPFNKHFEHAMVIGIVPASSLM